MPKNFENEQIFFFFFFLIRMQSQLKNIWELFLDLYFIWNIVDDFWKIQSNQFWEP